MGSRAVIMREMQDAPIEDRTRVLSIEAFKAYFHNRGSAVWKREKQADGTWQSTKRYVKWAPQWLAAKNRRTYDGIEFFPDAAGAAGTPNYFNVWRGFGCEPDPAPAEERRLKYKTFRDHLFTNVCSGDRELFDWVFAWCAHVVQRPRERIGTAIVLRGKMGTGKTKVGEIIGSLPAPPFLAADQNGERAAFAGFSRLMCFRRIIFSSMIRAILPAISTPIWRHACSCRSTKDSGPATRRPRAGSKG